MLFFVFFLGFVWLFLDLLVDVVLIYTDIFYIYFHFKFAFLNFFFPFTIFAFFFLCFIPQLALCFGSAFWFVF